LRENKKCYLIAGNECFLLRFTNTFFGSKWFGIWFPPYKFLDYFAYRITHGNDTFWLTKDTQEHFTYLPDMAKHIFKYKSHVILEEVYPTIGSGIVSELKWLEKPEGEIEVFCEVGVNLRKYYEDFSSNDVKVQETENGFKIYNSTVNFLLGCDHKLRINRGFWKEHFPGDYVRDWMFFNEVPQRCFVIELSTGLKGNSIKFLFSRDGKWEKLERKVEVDVDQTYEEILRSSLLSPSIFKQSYDGNFGYVAGFPYFLDFWVRDECINIQNFLFLGEFQNIRKALEKHIKMERKGTIPFLIRHNGQILYHSADTTPLWLITLFHYLKFTNDWKFLAEYEDRIKNCLFSFFKLDEDDDYLAECRNLLSWMDSINREGKPIEIQALWAKAFLEAYDLFEEKWLRSIGEKILMQIEKFYHEGFYWDRLVNSWKGMGRSSNPVWLTFYKLLNKQRAEQILNVLEGEEFTTRRGIRSFSTQDPHFSPNSYHRGMVWNLLTNLMIISEFNYGRVEKGFKYLELLLQNYGARCMGSLDEVYDGNLSPQGALSQAWSISFIPRIFYEFILGIRPNTFEKIITMAPIDQDKVKRFSGKFRVEDRVFEIKFRIDREGRKVFRILEFPEDYKLLLTPPSQKFSVNHDIYTEKAVLEGKYFEIRY